MIRYTTYNDIGKIGELLKEWTGKEPDDRILLNSLFVVAQEDGDLIGCTQLIIIDDPFWNRCWGLVENVYVKKGHRGKGIAKELMETVEAQAFMMGCKFIKLTSALDKVAGHALYKTLGYVEGLSFKKKLVHPISQKKARQYAGLEK